MRRLEVAAQRLPRWVANFVAAHPGTVLEVSGGHLVGDAPDGARFTAAPPFDARYDGPPTPEDLAAATTAAVPRLWGVLLVRKGGFAVARLEGDRLVERKVGQRHVQGRTKAGGQSQQRFARRRDNQARQAYQAAADHAARILGGTAAPTPVVRGGDRAAVDAVLADPRLAHLTGTDHLFAVPDPRRSVLDDVVARSLSVVVEVEDPART